MKSFAVQHRSDDGFTIIEMLIIVVIIGILAVITVQKFAGVKTKTYVAAMKSDLRNLVSAEEAFFADSGTYVVYGDTSKLRFVPSLGVRTPQIVVGSGYWSATLTHAAVPNLSCGIAVHTRNPVDSTANDGAPACR